MVRTKGLKIIFLIVSVILIFTYLYIPASADSDYSNLQVGLNIIPQSGKTVIERGDNIKFVVLSPNNFESNADNISISVKFDPEVFEIDPESAYWDVVVAGDAEYSKFTRNVFTDSEGTYFTLVAASGTLKIGDSDDGGMVVHNNPFILTIPVHVKENARKETADVSLTKHTAWYSIGTGANDYKEMWGGTETYPKTVTLTNLPPNHTLTTDGLTVTPSIVNLDDTVTVNIDVPQIAWDTDPAEFTVKYDTSKFELVSWEPAVGTRTVDPTAGTFGAKDIDANRGLDSALHYTATLKVKDNAEKGEATFNLITDFKEKNGTAVLWDPENKEKTVYVTALPVTAGGLSLSTNSVNRDKNEKVTVTVTVPPINDTADSGKFTVKFNPTAFRVTNVSAPSMTAVSFVPDNDAGTITFTGNGEMNLAGGLKFTAQLEPKDSAALSTPYSFLLEDAVLTKTETRYEETFAQKIWLPLNKDGTVSVVGSYPVPGKGISVSKSSVGVGDTFKVTITVPAIKGTADAIDLSAAYNPVMFEYVEGSGETNLDGFTVTDNGNSFGIASTGSGIDLKNEIITVSAEMKVKYTATKGPYKFTLTKEYPITYKDADDKDVSMWTPTTREAPVTITKDSTDYPVESDGISVSPSKVNPDGTFTATIKVPALNATADGFHVIVDFNETIFTVNSVSSSSPNNISTDFNYGFFLADLTGDDLKLTSGITITANMKLNSNAVLGNTYDLTIRNDNYLTGKIADDALSQNLWKPHNTTAKVTVRSPEDDYPVTNGGISFSTSNVYQGDQFTLYIKVPPIDASVNLAEIAVGFDGNAFEVVTWDPRISGGVPTYDANSLKLSVANSGGLDLSNGLTLSATMRAKTNATANRYRFVLTKSSITSNTISKGLWSPTTSQDYVTVVSRSNPNNNNNNNYPYYPYYPDYTRWSPNTQYPVVYYSSDSPSDNNSGQQVIYDPEDDDDNRYPDSDNSGNGNNGGNNGDGNGDLDVTNSANKNIKISLNGDLKNVSNSGIKANTKKYFFSGDTAIIIRNTDIADASAAEALTRLAMSNCQSYAFDVSVYDYSTGTYIHKLPTGYIDISIPVPTSMSGSPDNIVVYHTEDGNPEYIKCTVVNENGMDKIKFRTTEFSPYMFVDPTSVKNNSGNSSGGNYTAPTNNYNNYSGNGGQGGSNGGNENGGTSYTGNTPRPANPNTGSAVALVLIPAATLGCVLLAKRGKKRKRSQRR
ncbi:MAG: hypothetical protein J6O50_06440 [Ruminiclostridium sp.]|nr:hypothetical protein [Ruminiclostridium sp.]